MKKDNVRSIYRQTNLRLYTDRCVKHVKTKSNLKYKSEWVSVGNAAILINLWKTWIRRRLNHTNVYNIKKFGYLHVNHLLFSPSLPFFSIHLYFFFFIQIHPNPVIFPKSRGIFSICFPLKAWKFSKIVGGPLDRINLLRLLQ